MYILTYVCQRCQHCIEVVETEVAVHNVCQRCRNCIEAVETEVAVLETPVEDVEIHTVDTVIETVETEFVLERLLKAE